MKKTILALALTGFTLPVLSHAETVEKIQAQIVAKDQAQIGAPMNGRLESLPFRDGDTFKKGDVLASYHCATQYAQLERGKAEYAKASGIMSLQRKAQEMGQFSRADVISNKADLDLARADESAAQAAISDCKIIAPYDGVVGGISVHNYQFTSIGSPVMDILSLQAQEVSMIVPSGRSNIKVGSKFTITLNENGKPYKGSIVRLSGKYDPVSKTVRAYGSLDAESDVRPGMTGVVVFND